MSDLVRWLRDLSIRNFLSRAEILSLQDHGRKAADEITRLQSALSEAQAQGEMMRTALENFVALEDGEAHIEDAFERLLPAAKAALQSTPPTAVGRVIEAEKRGAQAFQELLTTLKDDRRMDIVFQILQDRYGAADRQVKAALAALDGGRKSP